MDKKFFFWRQSHFWNCFVFHPLVNSRFDCPLHNLMSRFKSLNARKRSVVLRAIFFSMHISYILSSFSVFHTLTGAIHNLYIFLINVFTQQILRYWFNIVMFSSMYSIYILWFYTMAGWDFGRIGDLSWERFFWWLIAFTLDGFIVHIWAFDISSIEFPFFIK